MKNQGFFRRLQFACSGIIGTVRGESSFRTQLVLGMAATLVLLVVRPPAIWVALCVLAAGAVLALEMLNTALEHLADRLHPEWHEAIRRAKDCAAGAVLLASFTAMVIGSMTIAVALGWLT